MLIFTKHEEKPSTPKQIFNPQQGEDMGTRKVLGFLVRRLLSGHFFVGTLLGWLH